jgi:hypothetical protein
MVRNQLTALLIRWDSFCIHLYCLSSLASVSGLPIDEVGPPKRQVTGMRAEVTTKKTPTDHHRKPIWLTAGSLWEPWPWQDEDKEYFFFPATLM